LAFNATPVRLRQYLFSFRKTAKPALAGLLGLLLLLLSTLAASPDLHQRLHADSNSPDHNCAITLFAKGQINAAPAAAVLVGFVSLAGALVLLAETLLLPSADYRFSASRAPPFSSSLR
jgi:hypothetical protein